MAHFTAGVALAVVVMVTADPTLRPSTPPTRPPTAPSPRPTSSTPQPTDLIRIIEQDVQSAPFDLPSNICAAFQVQFEGGSDKKFRVQITDSERGLNYVAAGLAYYNKNDGQDGRTATPRTTGPRSIRAKRPRATARNRCSKPQLLGKSPSR